MKKFILSMFVLANIMFAQDITILAAASLKYVLASVIKDYEVDHKNLNFKVNYIASGKALAQIESGLPADLFVSANQKYPEKLYAEKLGTKPVTYAQGALVLWSNVGVEIKDLGILKSVLKSKKINGIKLDKIASPDPKLAPYGRAAFEVMKKEGVLAKLEKKKKIVLGKNIGTTTALIKAKAAPLGFTALSVLIGKEGLKYYVIDKSMYSPINQAYTMTNKGAKRKVVQEFVKYMASPAALKRFKEYGYIIPKAATK